MSPIYLYWHSEGEHPIINHNHEGTFKCSAKKYLRKCFASSSNSTSCYSCIDCDFNICEECLQVSVLIQTIENMDNH